MSSDTIFEVPAEAEKVIGIRNRATFAFKPKQKGLLDSSKPLSFKHDSWLRGAATYSN
jgi:hypothetical protein